MTMTTIHRACIALCAALIAPSALAAGPVSAPDRVHQCMSGCTMEVWAGPPLVKKFTKDGSLMTEAACFPCPYNLSGPLGVGAYEEKLPAERPAVSGGGGGVYEPVEAVPARTVPYRRDHGSRPSRAIITDPDHDEDEDEVRKQSER